MTTGRQKVVRLTHVPPPGLGPVSSRPGNGSPSSLSHHASTTGQPRAQIANQSPVLPHDGSRPAPRIEPEEVTKVALRLRHLIEQCVPCELEESLITQAHSRVITTKVLKAAQEAGGEQNRACVVFCLLVCSRWFKRQGQLELWDADLHNVRATACEVIAKAM
jgi:hypothetical protein